MKILLATVFGAATCVTAKNAYEASSATVPCNGAETSKILQPTDTVEVVGCEVSTDPKAVFDGSISDFLCTKGPLEKFGQIIISNPGRFSIVDGFRLYASTDAFGDGIDLLDYKVEGRGDIDFNDLLEEEKFLNENIDFTFDYEYIGTGKWDRDSHNTEVASEISPGVNNDNEHLNDLDAYRASTDAQSVEDLQTNQQQVVKLVGEMANMPFTSASGTDDE